MEGGRVRVRFMVRFGVSASGELVLRLRLVLALVPALAVSS